MDMDVHRYFGPSDHADERAYLEGLMRRLANFHERVRNSVDQSSAPPVDEDLLRAEARGELDAQEWWRVQELCFTYKSWADAAWKISTEAYLEKRN